MVKFREKSLKRKHVFGFTVSELSCLCCCRVYDYTWFNPFIGKRFNEPHARLYYCRSANMMLYLCK